MKANDIKLLISSFGNISLIEAFEKMKMGNQFECPKCKGRGLFNICIKPENYGYWDAVYKDVDCALCNGIGYTPKEYKPKIKTEIIGYE